LSKMKIPFAVIADGANVSREGKLNILGIFDTLFARKFPVTHPEMKLVMRVEASAEEAGFKHAIEIKLVDSAGGAVLGVKAEVVPRGVPGGKPLRMDQVVSLHNVTFKAPGAYRFAIIVDNGEKASVPLRVNEAPARPAVPGGPGGPGEEHGGRHGPEGDDPTSGGLLYH
jgi:hypothetical protein